MDVESVTSIANTLQIYFTSHHILSIKNKSDEIHMHHSTSQTDRPKYAPRKNKQGREMG